MLAVLRYIYAGPRFLGNPVSPVEVLILSKILDIRGIHWEIFDRIGIEDASFLFRLAVGVDDYDLASRLRNNRVYLPLHDPELSLSAAGFVKWQLHTSRYDSATIAFRKIVDWSILCRKITPKEKANDSALLLLSVLRNRKSMNIPRLSGTKYGLGKEVSNFLRVCSDSFLSQAIQDEITIESYDIMKTRFSFFSKILPLVSLLKVRI
jgi:hypothetical protein